MNHPIAVELLVAIRAIYDSNDRYEFRTGDIIDAVILT